MPYQIVAFALVYHQAAAIIVPEDNSASSIHHISIVVHPATTNEMKNCS
jgi:hypothetical protein